MGSDRTGPDHTGSDCIGSDRQNSDRINDRDFICLLLAGILLLIRSEFCQPEPVRSDPIRSGPIQSGPIPVLPMALPGRETTASNRSIFYRACAKYVTPNVMHWTSLLIISRENMESLHSRLAQTQPLRS